MTKKQHGSSLGLSCEEPFERRLEELKKINNQYFKIEELTWFACKAVGNINLEDMVESLEKLPQ